MLAMGWDDDEVLQQDFLAAIQSESMLPLMLVIGAAQKKDF
jgi:hypothetical protein